MPETKTAELDFPDAPMPASWMIGARNLMMDRIVPQLEYICQPACTYDGGKLTMRADGEPSIADCTDLPRRARLKKRLAGHRPVHIDGPWCIDMRRNTYFNWSHQLNDFLPMAAYVCDWAGVPHQDVTVVFAEGMSKTALRLYEWFGFRTVTSNQPVVGRWIDWAFLPDNDIVANFRAQATLKALDHAPADFSEHLPHLPTKILLARKDTRRLTNEAEVEALLAPLGYQKVYAEDFSVKEQFALWRQATDVVAIHGAAIAPLAFRDPGKPLSFVEILPCGHVVGFFRLMAHQVGARYVAVRGKPKPEYIKPAYADEPFYQFSLDDFEIDVESLRCALDVNAGLGQVILPPI